MTLSTFDFLSGSNLLCMCLSAENLSFCLFPQICKLIFLPGRRERRERAVSPGGYSSLRGAAGQILWQCISIYFAFLSSSYYSSLFYES